MIRTLFVAAVAASSIQAGSAPEPDFCDDVRLVTSAARAHPPFSTLPPQTFEQGHGMFGLAWPCRLMDGGQRLHCTQYVTYEREAETMAAETARCLPEAQRDPDESSEGSVRGEPLTFPYYRARFHLPGFTIEIDRNGNPINHLGQFVSYDVILDGAR